MPELPEVEVTRMSFGDRIAGARITGVRLGKPLRWPLGCAPESLVGWSVACVRRRGKYLLLDLASSIDKVDEPKNGGRAPQGLLLIHLGMSGSLTFERQWSDAGTHDHFDLETTHGLLRLHDPRRFGAVVYADNQESAAAQKLLGKLGMEPLGDGFDAHLFHAGLAGRNAPIKQVLLAGAVVVGVGNIYASEALFMAGIRPTSRAGKLSRPRVARLHQSIRLVLARAVEKGGSTLKDFSNAKGESGYFQLEAMVYGRQGQPCKTCGTPIQTIRQGQRSTFFCAQCQKP